MGAGCEPDGDIIGAAAHARLGLFGAGRDSIEDFARTGVRKSGGNLIEVREDSGAAESANEVNWINPDIRRNDGLVEVYEATASVDGHRSVRVQGYSEDTFESFENPGPRVYLTSIERASDSRDVVALLDEQTRRYGFKSTLKTVGAEW
ncbi:hypothetical protein HN604_02315 [archaeon]|jgi:hypothetical protein|nr:hypothetical protein [archaeon]MBT6183070.1 hypothetical protein [archaeon]MBT6606238.1 hypothetical protein [archaeon]MBT7251593.1 hypothetical protein [archaeon]MBT7660896.1 hypothetical protein [archaeon]